MPNQTDWMIDARYERITIQSLKEAMHDPRVFWGAAAMVILSSYSLDQGKRERIEKNRIPYLFLQVEDLRTPIIGRSFTHDMGEQVKAFVQDLPDEIRYLHFCCDAGESRSAGLGAAWMRRMCYDCDDLPVWKSFKRPNPLVYKIMSEVLGVPVTNEELEYRIELNNAVFRQAMESSR